MRTWLGLGGENVLKRFSSPVVFAFNGNSGFCAINRVDTNKRGILCFGRNRAAQGGSAVALALRRRVQHIPEAQADPALRLMLGMPVAGKTMEKGGFKAFLENSAQVLRGHHRGDGKGLRSAQERADSLRGACIFESVYNAINSVYP